jgi:hypothetical protein
MEAKVWYGKEAYKIQTPRNYTEESIQRTKLLFKHHSFEHQISESQSVRFLPFTLTNTNTRADNVMSQST